VLYGILKLANLY